MCEDFWGEEVDWVKGIVGVGADGSHVVAACQGSGGVVGWRANTMRM